jgi:hypothetical protein
MGGRKRDPLFCSDIGEYPDSSAGQAKYEMAKVDHLHNVDRSPVGEAVNKCDVIQSKHPLTRTCQVFGEQ